MCEDAPCCGCCGPEPLEPELMSEAMLDIETRGWPGDGSGEDDLADLMAVGDEGCCDGPEDLGWDGGMED